MIYLAKNYLDSLYISLKYVNLINLENYVVISNIYQCHYRLETLPGIFQTFWSSNYHDLMV